MNAREYVASKCGEPDNAQAMLDALLDAKTLWEGDRSPRRHWIDVFRVVELDGKLIGFGFAEGAGDQGIWDAGWEFDPASICFVEAYEVTTTAYRVVAENTPHA